MWPARSMRPLPVAAIGIRGQAGQQVVAAADGEVVYSGTALIGYGELIIIKHSSQLTIGVWAQPRSTGG